MVDPQQRADGPWTDIRLRRRHAAIDHPVLARSRYLSEPANDCLRDRPPCFTITWWGRKGPPLMPAAMSASLRSSLGSCHSAVGQLWSFISTRPCVRDALTWRGTARKSQGMLSDCSRQASTRLSSGQSPEKVYRQRTRSRRSAQSGRRSRRPSLPPCSHSSPPSRESPLSLGSASRSERGRLRHAA